MIYKDQFNGQKASTQMRHFRAQGQRRIVATQPNQIQQYIDYRNLWKASTINQQKQYKAIRQSGIMNQQRKVTFLKFNYRHSQDKNLAYNQICKNFFNITKDRQRKRYKQANKTERKYRLKNKEFITLTKQILAKVNDGSLMEDQIFDINQKVKEAQKKTSKNFILKKKSNLSMNSYSNAYSQRSGSSFNLLVPTERLDQKSNKQFIQKDKQNWFNKFYEKKQKLVQNQDILRKTLDVAPGSMNVCDLWGEKQLKESLGFLPCVRDRPKLLKLYSNKIKSRNHQKNEKILENSLK